MFVYCNNNAYNMVDATGTLPASVEFLQFVIWNGDGGSQRRNGQTIDRTSLTSVSVESSMRSQDSMTHPVSNNLVSALLENIRISGGIGYGLYVEGELMDIGVAGGTYHDFFAFEWQNGKLSTFDYGYAGLTATLIIFDVGGEVSVQWDKGVYPVTNSWILCNNQQDTVFSNGVALYTPLFGSRFHVCLDWVGLYQDLGLMH